MDGEAPSPYTGIGVCGLRINGGHDREVFMDLRCSAGVGMRRKLQGREAGHEEL